MLEAGLPLARSRRDASVLYHNIGLAHRVHGNWENGVNALRVALDLAPTDDSIRTDMLQVLHEWQDQKLNQTDLQNAPIFVKPFNKKGVRPFRLPAETKAEVAKGKGRVVRAQRVNAYPRVVTIDKLVSAKEAQRRAGPLWAQVSAQLGTPPR